LKQVIYHYRTSKGLPLPINEAKGPTLLDRSSSSISDDQDPSLQFCLTLNKFGLKRKKKKKEEKRAMMQ